MGETRLILIRHAHIDAGKDGRRMCGWLDWPLSSIGQSQLQSLNNQPSEVTPEAVYASTSSRARLTAEALASNWRVQVKIDPDLREINSGDMEGMLIEEVKRRFPDLWTRNASQDDSDFAWPGGETYRKFRERICRALSRIAGRHPNARIPVVTHTGVIAQAVGAIKGLSPAVWEQHRPAPLTATEVIWSGEAPVHLLSFNVADWWRGLQLHAE